MTQQIIDIHPHIVSADTVRYPIAPLHGDRSDWSAMRAVTFEQLIAEMDEAGVAKAAIVHSVTTYGTDNSYVADSVAQEPQRFIGVYSIDMLAQDALKTFDHMLALGMGGIRLYTGGDAPQMEGRWLVNPATFPIWQRCADTGLAVAIWTTPVGLPMVAELAARFPSVKFALDHCARPVLKGGPPYAGCEEMFKLARYDNVYLKITPRTFDVAQAAPGGAEPFFARLVDAFGADHLAFGSNYPASEGPLKRLIEQGCACFAGLSEGERAWVWGGTAQVLYPSLAAPKY